MRALILKFPWNARIPPEPRSYLTLRTVSPILDGFLCVLPANLHTYGTFITIICLWLLATWIICEPLIECGTFSFTDSRGTADINDLTWTR